ncbi:hypothetical protein [Roseomonas xinghualingensis]|uniref:hypothetical protein n=1 Tax=Roseomonas xinghualingensis TaxID=2986475 RepID=UPI0021F112EA|nr:hypothetical protein [Roseomonas sp. SXEYE001]MCV4206507.1 hypothetical protein [Roseomonas sp. SXEYE001]
MANIHWNQQFFVDSATLQPASSGIPLPTYGNFGGAGYSQGVFSANPDPAQFDPVPVDALDQQFEIHDQESAAADTVAEQAAADVTLIRGIEAANQVHQPDPEAALYGGGATLAMIEQLAAANSLELLAPGEFAEVSGNALESIGRGIAGLSAEEAGQAADWLGDVADAVGVDIPLTAQDVSAVQGRVFDLIF